jgi:hypothetical protein
LGAVIDFYPTNTRFPTDSTKSTMPNKKVKDKKKQLRARTPRTIKPQNVSLLTLHPETIKYLKFMVGTHPNISDLKPPHLNSHLVARRVCWARYLPTTNSNSVGAVIISPFNFPQGICYADNSGTASAAASPVYYTTTNWAGSLSTGLIPGNTGVAVGASAENAINTGGYQNASGPRRWVAAKITVRYLGTALNSGTELFLYHNATMQGLMNTTCLNALTTGRDSERVTLNASKSTHSFLLFPRGIAETEFQEAKAFANVGNVGTGTGVATDNYVDPDYWGSSTVINDAGGYPTMFGDGYSPKGWNIGLVMQSAAASQPYEVIVEIAYEGRFFNKYGGGTLNPSGITSITDMASPNHTTIPCPQDHGILSHVANKLAASRSADGLKTKSAVGIVKEAIDEIFPHLVKAGINYAGQGIVAALTA